MFYPADFLADRKPGFFTSFYFDAYADKAGIRPDVFIKKAFIARGILVIRIQPISIHGVTRFLYQLNTASKRSADTVSPP